MKETRNDPTTWRATHKGEEWDMGYQREDNPDTGEIIHRFHGEKVGGSGERIDVEEIYNHITGGVNGQITGKFLFVPLPDSARAQGVLSFTNLT